MASVSPLRRPSERKVSNKARDLLRQHYGLNHPAPTGSPNDPLDIDSPAFDARGYYSQLVAVSSLPALLKRNNDLAEEVRQLETDRQALVYNHHHELVAASDTIRAMKSRAENVDSELDKLKDAFSEISRIGAKLSVEISSEGRQSTPPKAGSTPSSQTS